MKKRVLVFPCGSEVGLEIHASVQYSTHFELVGGSSTDDHGKFVYEQYVDGLPYVDDPDFTDRINEVTKKMDIDFIFPAHDSVVLKLAEESARGTLHAQVLTSPVETARLARSKKRTYEAFKEVLAVPKLYSQQEATQADYPLFLKPDTGQGSKGTQKALSAEDISFYCAKDPSLLVMEYLPGKEYTIDCFTNHKGQLLFCEGRERRRIQNGISVGSVTVTDGRFKNLADKINSTTPLRGAWFFQVKENAAHELVLMEIAPRIAGTMGLVRNRGVNLALLTLFDACGMDVVVFENKETVIIDRALTSRFTRDLLYAHVYLDFDDLVIFDGQVNTTVMAFVYQCINQNKQIHLLTKHADDLDKSLKKHRLTGVFDNLIHISPDDEKVTYVKEKDAIFIDDSYAERKKVHDALGIPVFDAHMIESLITK